jgi:hypothetical protein
MVAAFWGAGGRQMRRKPARIPLRDGADKSTPSRSIDQYSCLIAWHEYPRFGILEAPLSRDGDGCDVTV